MIRERWWEGNFFTFLSYYMLGATLPVYVLTRFHADNTQVGCWCKSLRRQRVRSPQQERWPRRRQTFGPSWNPLPIALCGFLMAFGYGGISAFAPVYGNALRMTKLTTYFFAVYALIGSASASMVRAALGYGALSSLRALTVKSVPVDRKGDATTGREAAPVIR